jgi:hypothetical protein
MNIKEFTVKENDGFKLRVKSWKCIYPSDLNAIEFIQESKNKKGEIDLSSTYQFFMTDTELKTLAQGIVNE